MLGLYEKGKVLDAIESTRQSLKEARLEEEAASKHVAEAQQELERFQRSLELVVATSIREGHENALKRLSSHLARTSQALTYVPQPDNLCAETLSYKHTPKRTSFLRLLYWTRDGATSTAIDASSCHGPQRDGWEGTRAFFPQFRGDMQSC
jgi:DNA repair ATPase RecN